MLLLLGLALFGGTIGGRIFEKLRIPQVVGYIIIGVLIGETGLKLVDVGILNERFVKPLSSPQTTLRHWTEWDRCSLC